MTIAQLAHQDSTERATALLGFNAWLDAQQPSPEEQDRILSHMEQEDLQRQADLHFDMCLEDLLAK
jgi:hypothetical protein